MPQRMGTSSVLELAITMVQPVNIFALVVMNSKEAQRVCASSIQSGQGLIQHVPVSLSIYIYSIFF